MKKICLVLSVMVAVLMLVSATKVGAASCDPTLPPGWCFESKGYKVEIVPDSEGNFPQTINNNSVYTYRITKSTAMRRFKEVDILIPVCTPGLENPIAYSCSSPICVGKFYKGGSGDPSTGFGLGLTTDDTWNWNMFGERDSITVSFTFQGKTYASQNALLVRVGLILRDYVYGQILAPSCGLIPAQVFPPQVPLATKKQEKISEVEICIESTDQSGFPTSVYSCSLPDTPACDCPSENKLLWEKKSLSDLKIPVGTLKQVWIDPDPRSPATYIMTEGSTCVRKCYPSGYCYVGPPGCKSL